MKLVVSPWERKELYKLKPSVDELIRLHHQMYKRDKFAQVMYEYPFGKHTMANAIKALIPRKDYEFFVARLKPSNEIVGWIALSFDIEGDEAENREKYEARLEWTEMCSHILRYWKVDNAGEKSNVRDMIKRASSSLQAKHLPRNYCILNTLVVEPELQGTKITRELTDHAIKFWRKRVMIGTEWAMWVQAPPFAQGLYKEKHSFKELGEYTVDLGDYGFLPKKERQIFGEYGWKFMVLRGPSGSALKEPDGARKADKGKSKEQPLEDEEEHVPVRKVEKGKGKAHRPDDQQQDEPEDLSERDAKRKRDFEEAEERLEEIRTKRGPPPLPGEVACLIRIQRKAEDRGLDTMGPWKGRSAQKREEERPGPPGEPLQRPLQRDADVTGPPQDNFVPTKSEEDLIEAMRAGGVDEEQIELVKALAFSLTYETGGD